MIRGLLLLQQASAQSRNPAREALSAGDLARRTGLAAASVTDLVDRLESRGFVRRVRGSTDRRRVLVEPVADQLTGAHELFASTRRSLARLFARYADRDLEVIADYLRRNAERLRRETDMLERGH
jgi:DNA-binding MarR family transcriptional regulator